MDFYSVVVIISCIVFLICIILKVTVDEDDVSSIVLYTYFIVYSVANIIYELYKICTYQSEISHLMVSALLCGILIYSCVRRLAIIFTH